MIMERYKNVKIAEYWYMNLEMYSCIESSMYGYVNKLINWDTAEY